MKLNESILISIPLLPPFYILTRIFTEYNPVVIFSGWINSFVEVHLRVSSSEPNREDVLAPPPIGDQLLVYLLIAFLGYRATDKLVPIIQFYTLRKGISGKDLCKRGTKYQDIDVPEALGIVPGAIFLICLTFCLVGYATSHPAKLLDCNSALLSICFMLFLGFTDDVLDWPWRYKLILPTIASLPLLCCYNGSTSIVIPIQMRLLLMRDNALTWFGRMLCYFVVVDEKANGSIVNLGLWYSLYMGLLSVFCTNAINIYAGINGLEAGQSFIIACAILLHNLIEIQNRSLSSENHLFSVMIILSFIGVTLGLLKHNWFPASVFVGDTYCYFAGMTFAVVGILGHFSKTLILFFIPQIANFIYSTPQLFKFVPCPRHRLPSYNPETGLMEPSTFDYSQGVYKWLKRRKDGKVANMTVINLTLQLLGPMHEKDLCTALLCLQFISCGFAFYVRYYLAQIYFDV